MEEEYGFAIDLSLTPQQNAIIAISNTPMELYCSRPQNKSFHDLTIGKIMPKATKSILGLSHKFIPTPKVTSYDIEDRLDRLERDIHLKVYFAANPLQNKKPQLYVKSKWRPPYHTIPGEVHRRLSSYSSKVRSIFTKKRGKSNLLPFQQKLMAKLKANSHFLIGRTDKGLGPFGIEFERYAQDGLELLSNPNNYQFLTEAEARAKADHVFTLISTWLCEHRRFVSDDEAKYIRKKTTEALEDPYGYLYLMYKVHKPKLSVRAVVSDCASLTNALSKWVDVQLQPIMRGLKTYFKDSFELKKKLDTFVVPPGGLLFTCDAVGMYPNIDTNIAMARISAYLRDEATQKRFPHYNARALIAALEIVMRNNLTKFGDTHWNQLSGTAMGKPPAPPFASIFEGLNEMEVLIEFSHNLPLYDRFIDDGLGCWVPTSAENDNNHWQNYKARMCSGCLDWTFEERGLSVDYMDMTISIKSNRLITTLYEKPTALHLFIPPGSSHPPGCTKGHIYGETLRIHRLCSEEEDITQRVTTFFRRLMLRGYSPSYLLPTFKKALQKAKHFMASSEEYKDQQKQLKSELAKHQAYFHIDWHPQNPSAQEIQQLFSSTVLTPPGKIPFNQLGPGKQDIPLDALVIANHRTPNLGDYFSYRKLSTRDGPSISSFMK